MAREGLDNTISDKSPRRGQRESLRSSCLWLTSSKSDITSPAIEFAPLSSVPSVISSCNAPAKARPTGARRYNSSHGVISGGGASGVFLLLDMPLELSVDGKVAKKRQTWRAPPCRNALDPEGDSSEARNEYRLVPSLPAPHMTLYITYALHRWHHCAE
jgi:hypothetical protein